MGLLKVVVDVNVVVSAVFGGRPERALKKALTHTLLISAPIEAELAAVAIDLREELALEQRRSFERFTRRVIRSARRVEVSSQLHLCLS